MIVPSGMKGCAPSCHMHYDEPCPAGFDAPLRPISTMSGAAFHHAVDCMAYGVGAKITIAHCEDTACCPKTSSTEAEAKRDASAEQVEQAEQHKERPAEGDAEAPDGARKHQKDGQGHDGQSAAKADAAGPDGKFGHASALAGKNRQPSLRGR